jgi:hypothetical protein
VIEFTADSSPFATITCDFDVDDMPALRTHYKEVPAPTVCVVSLVVSCRWSCSIVVVLRTFQCVIPYIPYSSSR